MSVVDAPLKKHYTEAVFSTMVGKRNTVKTLQKKVKYAYMFSEIYVI